MFFQSSTGIMILLLFHNVKLLCPKFRSKNGCFHNVFRGWNDPILEYNHGEKGILYEPTYINSITPGKRKGYVMWEDEGGDDDDEGGGKGGFWIFGGVVVKEGNSTGVKNGEWCGNDLWMYRRKGDREVKGNGWIWFGGNGDDSNEVEVSRIRTLDYDDENMPSGRSLSVGFRTDKELYLFGGRGPGLGIYLPYDEWDLGDMWSFHIEKEQWKCYSEPYQPYNNDFDYPDLSLNRKYWPLPRSLAMSWSYLNDDGYYKFYVFGGLSSNKVINDFYVYDVLSSKWEMIGGGDWMFSETGPIYSPMNMVYPGAIHSATSFSYRERLFLFGGFAYNAGNFFTDDSSQICSGFVNDIWRYITENGRGFSAECDKREGVYSGNKQEISGRILSIAWFRKGKIYVFGGSGFDSQGDEGNLNDFFYFDLTSKKWTYYNIIEGAPPEFAYPLLKDDPGQDAEVSGLKTYGVYPSARSNFQSSVSSNRVYFYSGDSNPDVWFLEYPHQCDGIYYWESSVCSGNGNCVEDELCECDEGFEGDYCLDIVFVSKYRQNTFFGVPSLLMNIFFNIGFFVFYIIESVTLFCCLFILYYMGKIWIKKEMIKTKRKKKKRHVKKKKKGMKKKIQKKITKEKDSDVYYVSSEYYCSDGSEYKQSTKKKKEKRKKHGNTIEIRSSTEYYYSDDSTSGFETKFRAITITTKKKNDGITPKYPKKEKKSKKSTSTEYYYHSDCDELKSNIKKNKNDGIKDIAKKEDNNHKKEKKSKSESFSSTTSTEYYYPHSDSDGDGDDEMEMESNINIKKKFQVSKDLPPPKFKGKIGIEMFLTTPTPTPTPDEDDKEKDKDKDSKSISVVKKSPVEILKI